MKTGNSTTDNNTQEELRAALADAQVRTKEARREREEAERIAERARQATRRVDQLVGADGGGEPADDAPVTKGTNA
jgi:hypothetical protein